MTIRRFEEVLRSLVNHAFGNIIPVNEKKTIFLYFPTTKTQPALSLSNGKLHEAFVIDYLQNTT